MQIGECPHDGCDDVQMRRLPDRPLPALSKETCPGCGGDIWLYYSRVDPSAFTPEQFAEHFEINEATKSVSIKKPWQHEPEPPRPPIPKGMGLQSLFDEFIKEQKP